MTRKKGIILLLAALCAVFGVRQFVPSPGTAVSTPFEAAMAVETALLEGEDTVTLQADGLDESQLFRVLESTWPYAFSLHATTYDNGRMKITIEQARAAAQEQAELLAGQLARQETAGLSAPREQLRALHDLLVRSCRYDQETAALGTAADGASDSFTAYGALVNGKAVCAGYARAFVLLCRSVGLDAVYIADEGMNHGWNAVRLDGETYFIDCTFDDPVPDRGDYVSDEFFLVTAETLAETHTWDAAFYEQIMDARWGVKNSVK